MSARDCISAVSRRVLGELEPYPEEGVILLDFEWSLLGAMELGVGVQKTEHFARQMT